VCAFSVFLKNNSADLRQIFFQDLGENTCYLLQPALKSTRPSNPLIGGLRPSGTLELFLQERILRVSERSENLVFAFSLNPFEVYGS